MRHVFGPHSAFLGVTVLGAWALGAPALAQTDHWGFPAAAETGADLDRIPDEARDVALIMALDPSRWPDPAVASVSDADPAVFHAAMANRLAAPSGSLAPLSVPRDAAGRVNLGAPGALPPPVTDDSPALWRLMAFEGVRLALCLDGATASEECALEASRALLLGQ